MRHFIANNAVMFERIRSVELRQVEYQKESNEKFDQIFHYIADHEEANQKIFFSGQIFDAFSLLTSIINQAEQELLLIDGYVDVNTLNILSKKKWASLNIWDSSFRMLTNAQQTDMISSDDHLAETKVDFGRKQAVKRRGGSAAAN